MGNFLDKVGLQHFADKVKNLLKEYLPLSGGTMTGAIKYGTSEQDNDLITLTKNGLTCTKHLKNNTLNYVSSISPIIIDLAYQGENTEFGEVRQGSSSTLSFSGLSINVLSDKKSGSAHLTSTGCAAKKFTLSVNDSSITQKGLIANDSETVIPEVASSVIDEVVQNKGAEYTDAGYVSKANLGRLVKNLYDNISTNANNNSTYTIIKTTGIVKITTSDGEVTIPARVNYHIDGDYTIISGKENIHELIQSGTAQNGNKYFNGLKNLSVIDVSKLDISNVIDWSDYFKGCSSLRGFYSMGITRDYDIAYWATKKAKTFEGMFAGCSSLTILRLDSWDTRNVTRMNIMFAGCIKLKTLHLEGWNTQSVSLMGNMFSSCSAITSLYLSEGFGRMIGSVGTLDLSALTQWIDSSVQTLLELYNRKANGMSVITIKLSSATKNALGSNGISTLTAKGYTVA